MSANKRTFEVDRFLTRELLLRYPNNTPPGANQAIFTDGNGGVYFSPVASSNNISSQTSFNQLYLADSNQRIYADLSYNILTFKEGPGIRFLKQGANTVVFETSLVIPSTFTTISTGTGSTIIATNPSSVLNIDRTHGVNISVSSNKLIFGGIPGFTNVDISGQGTIAASDSLSTLKLNAGFGLSLTKVAPNQINIATNFSTYALNQLTVPNSSTFQFLNPFNNLNFTQQGNLQITKIAQSTLQFKTNSFAQISTPAGTLAASTTSESLNFKQGYGLNYQISSNFIQLQTSLPSSFQFISTARGTVSTPLSTNTLVLRQGYGIDYQVSTNHITIQLASTFASAIVTEDCSTIATTSSIFRFRKGDGILYSTATTGEFFIQATDFSRIDISGGASIFSYNTTLSTPVLNKSLRFIAGPGTIIDGDSATNSIRITTFSSISTSITAPPNAFAFIKVFSTITSIGGEVSSLTSNTLSASPDVSATLNMVGVQPMKVEVNNDVNRRLIYIGADVSSMLSSVNSTLDVLVSDVAFALSNLVLQNLVVSTISTQTLSSLAIHASSYAVNGSPVLFGSPTYTTILTTGAVSTQFVQAGWFRISTINDTPLSTPLGVFNYSSNSFGINIGSNQPQANLEVKGLVLADIYATYSDPSLKDFTNPLTITHQQISTLTPWNFTWKADQKPDIGFSAEDVEKIAPSAVQRVANGLRVVDYSKLSVIALAALRDTNSRLYAVESTLEGVRKNL